jgi:hypothetical protein
MKIPIGIQKTRAEKAIRIILKIGHECLYRIHVAQDMLQ